MPYMLGLGLGLALSAWSQLGQSAKASGASRRLSRRRTHHHVQRSLEWLERPKGSTPLVNASFYLDARVDHFGSIASPPLRWSQRYYIDERFWCGEGCPVFLYIGGEGPQGPPSPKLFFWHLAEKHGALMLALEHRFYGESRPVPDMSVESLRLLTSAQALADLVRFRSYISMQGVDLSKRQLGSVVGISSPPLRMKATAANSAWVAFGGSYPGALAAWLKIKYSAMFVGSVASSAPVYPEFDFSQYAEVVGLVLADPTLGGSAECAGLLRDAADALALAVARGALKAKRCTLPAALCPCTAPTGPRDVATYYASLMGNFQSVVQYNLEGRPPYVSDVCAAAWRAAVPLSRGAYPDKGARADSDIRNRLLRQVEKLDGMLAPLAAVIELFSTNVSSPDCVASSFEEDEIAPLRNVSFDSSHCDLHCGKLPPYVTVVQPFCIVSDMQRQPYF